MSDQNPSSIVAGAATRCLRVGSMDAILRGALETARAFVHEFHPECAAASLAGSVATGRGTPTSDLDIVIHYDDRPASFAETLRFDGWLIETFVYGPAGIDEWFERETVARRPVAIDMWSTGIPLVGQVEASKLQARANETLAAGPPALTSAERADLRYALTAAIDDLEGDPVPGEDVAITADVFKRSGELLLLDRRQWLGTGKWLVRRLAELSDPHATQLLEWARSPERPVEQLRSAAVGVLGTVGGPLQEGHVRGAKEPV